MRASLSSVSSPARSDRSTECKFIASWMLLSGPAGCRGKLSEDRLGYRGTAAGFLLH